MGSCVKAARIVYYEDLGCEAIRELKVEICRSPSSLILRERPLEERPRSVSQKSGGLNMDVMENPRAAL